MLQYRSDIDGLRAIAVISVIFYHANTNGILSGGFVGVDIFFVISGFLITSIMIGSDNNKFDFIDFYRRRVLRLLPVFYLVVFFSFLIGSIILAPSDFSSLNRSLTSAIFYLSNIYFWRESGYFGVENEFKPLLHTWSLSVEFQFYFIFPIVFLLLSRYLENIRFFLIVLLTLISLILSEFFIDRSPVAVFYLLPFRLWEFLFGALIADAINRGNFSYKDSTGKAISFLGFLCIIIPLGYYNSNMKFPALSAMPVVFGTAAIIYFNKPNSFIYRLLSLKPIVYIGLISYSAYMIHFPVFAFAKHFFLVDNVIIKSALVSLIFIISYLVYKYVEIPFRKIKMESARVLYIACILPFLLLFLVYFFTYTLKLPLTSSVVQGLNLHDRLIFNHGKSSVCDGFSYPVSDCGHDSSAKVAIWGDSIAMSLVNGIDAALTDKNIKSVQLTKSFCGPFVELAPMRGPYQEEWASGCLQHNKRVLNWLAESDAVSHVVISSKFIQYLSNTVLFYGDKKKSNSEYLVAALSDTVDKIIGMRKVPIIVIPPPMPDFDPARCLVKAYIRELPLSDCDYNIEHTKGDMELVRNIILENFDNVEIVDLRDHLCSGGVCYVSKRNVWIYRDQQHLSYEGSILLKNLWLRVIK